MPGHKRMSNEEFLGKLPGLYEQNTTGGTVFLEVKRAHDPVEGSSLYPSDLSDIVTSPNQKAYGILFRASASSTKLSTIVDPESLSTFYKEYSQLVKSHSTSLKKKDRRKQKEKQRKKKKALVANVAA